MARRFGLSRIVLEPRSKTARPGVTAVLSHQTFLGSGRKADPNKRGHRTLSIQRHTTRVTAYQHIYQLTSMVTYINGHSQGFAWLLTSMVFGSETLLLESLPSAFRHPVAPWKDQCPVLTAIRATSHRHGEGDHPGWSKLQGVVYVTWFSVCEYICLIVRYPFFQGSNWEVFLF